MKNNKVYIMVILIAIVSLIGCNDHSKEAHHHEAEGNHIDEIAFDDLERITAEDNHEEKITLTQKQIDILNIKIEPIVKRNMSGFIQVNGKLGVPPQNEAIVTSVLGANVNRIKAIEGDKVRMGQVLAYVTHPDIITMQTNYLQAYNSLTFLEQDYIRQKKLYDEKVGSGRDFQKAQSTFLSAKGLAKGFEAQLQLLGLSAKYVIAGNIAQVAPIKSPIDGFIEKVLIKTGQYVQAHTAMFEVVNTDHIHVDLMVFERDITKVKNGQMVKFSIEALGNKDMTATIYSVGKSFEEGPKALHIHAEIENKDKNLIPGMYVSARIITDENMEQALSEDAIFQEGETFYVFTAKKKKEGIWAFSPKKVIVKSTSGGFISFDFIDEINENTLFAQSGAYYLMAEMKKGEAKHSH